MTTCEVKGLKIERLAGDQRGKVRASWSAPTKKVYRTFMDSKAKSKSTHWKYANKVTDGYKVYFDYEVLDITASKKIVKRTVKEEWRTVKVNTLLFDVPEGATGITVHVIPMAKKYQPYKIKDGKHAKSGGEKPWYDGKKAWKTVNTGAFHNPERPEVSSAKVADDGITIEVSVKDSDPYTELFEVQGNSGAIKGTATAKTDTFTHSGSATVLLTGVPGEEYSIRARMRNIIGEWSLWYDGFKEKVRMRPAAAGTPTATATSEGTAALTWPAAKGADWYEIAYANDPKAFSLSSGYKTKSTKDLPSPASRSYTFDDLEKGKGWYFWVRGCNESGEGEWSDASSEVVLGSAPAAPSVWLDQYTCVRGESATVRWQHNSTDGSPQRAAEVWVSHGGAYRKTSVTGSTSFLDIETEPVADGTELKAYVVTYGVSREPSPSSEVVSLSVWDRPTAKVETAEVQERYPVAVRVSTSAPRQTCVVLSLRVTAVGDQEVTLPDGTALSVPDGGEVWSDVMTSVENPLELALMPSDLMLANGGRYRIEAECSMSSGLTCSDHAETRCSFDVQEVDVEGDVLRSGQWACEVVPSAWEITDEVIENGSAPAVAADGWAMSVYRIETDGSMTPLLRNAPSNGGYSVVDSHAPIAGQMYRVVAMREETGAVEFEDVSADYELAKGVLIQWGGPVAARARANGEAAQEVAQPTTLHLPWTKGSSHSGDKDVALNKPIGDRHPTSSYGTQLGLKTTWRTRIPETDTERIRLLRELQALRQDCYVRDRTGDGFWAYVRPSWDTDTETGVVEVTLDITRTSTTDACVDLGA